MQTIVISETPTGKVHFDVPKGHGHGKQKKDLYTSFMLAARGIHDLLWAEGIPASILHQAGIVTSRSGPPDSFILADGFQRTSANQMNIPDAISDRLEIAQDPEGFKRRILNGITGSRRVLTSPAAVLTPKPKTRR